MYTIVFQHGRKAYRYVHHSPNDDDIIMHWLYDMTAAYWRSMTYLLIIDADKKILLKYKRPAR